MLLTGKTFGILRKSITKQYPYYKQFKLANGGSLFQTTVNMKSAAIKKVMESPEPVPKAFMRLLTLIPETCNSAGYFESIKRSVYAIPNADATVKQECKEFLMWLNKYFQKKSEVKIVRPEEKKEPTTSGVTKIKVNNYSDMPLMIKFCNGVLEIRDVDSELLKGSIGKNYQFVGAGHNDKFMGREEDRK